MLIFFCSLQMFINLFHKSSDKVFHLGNRVNLCPVVDKLSVGLSPCWLSLTWADVKITWTPSGLFSLLGCVCWRRRRSVCAVAVLVLWRFPAASLTSLLLWTLARLLIATLVAWVLMMQSPFVIQFWRRKISTGAVTYSDLIPSDWWGLLMPTV